MTASIIIRKIRRNANDFGWRAAFGKCLRYLFKWVYAQRTYRIYRLDLAQKTWPELYPQGIVLRNVGRDDQEALEQIEEMEEWLQGKLPEIMSHGMCVAAFDGPAMVGFNLVAFERVSISLLNLPRRLRPGQAWSEQIAVAKAYRNRGLASALRYHVFRELQRRGIRMFYGGTLASNVPSVKSAEKVGFRFIVDVRYLKILNGEYRTYRRVKRVAH